jgi:hypothetical protein
MSALDISDLLFWSAMLFVLLWWCSKKVRYVLRRSWSRRWPVAEAKMQRGSFGGVPIGRGASVPASFIGYAFLVQGVRYAGFFAIYGEEPAVRRVSEKLAGQTIRIRYMPSQPDTSYLADRFDPRFEGLAASQDPESLNGAPAFDLQDAIR